jgi:hypothetical protein
MDLANLCAAFPGLSLPNTKLYRKNAFITELETPARSESKRMTNHNTPQLSRMDLANRCAAFPGLSLLNTRAVISSLMVFNNCIYTASSQILEFHLNVPNVDCSHTAPASRYAEMLDAIPVLRLQVHEL